MSKWYLMFLVLLTGCSQQYNYKVGECYKATYGHFTKIDIIVLIINVDKTTLQYDICTKKFGCTYLPGFILPEVSLKTFSEDFTEKVVCPENK